MLDPSPALIDTIVSAIFDTYVDLAQRDGYSGTDLIATLMTDYGSCLNAARAALDAMPEPVGYALLEDLPPEGDLPRDTYLREWVYRTPAEADSYNDTDNTRVVALVPAGDDHA